MSDAFLATSIREVGAKFMGEGGQIQFGDEGRAMLRLIIHDNFEIYSTSSWEMERKFNWIWHILVHSVLYRPRQIRVDVHVLAEVNSNKLKRG